MSVHCARSAQCVPGARRWQSDVGGVERRLKGAVRLQVHQAGHGQRHAQHLRVHGRQVQASERRVRAITRQELHQVHHQRRICHVKRYEVRLCWRAKCTGAPGRNPVARTRVEDFSTGLLTKTT